VMRQQLGLAKALEIGHEATRRLGGDMGKSYSDFGPDTTWRDCATPSWGAFRALVSCSSRKWSSATPTNWRYIFKSVL
ncbi:MAG TPA: hypothetical protein QGF63_18685, partial [Alphaproteobacteria bacterium]|nr:hypothetical protein [Alphaproteobacteria bacterium]